MHTFEGSVGTPGLSARHSWRQSDTPVGAYRLVRSATDTIGRSHHSLNKIAAFDGVAGETGSMDLSGHGTPSEATSVADNQSVNEGAHGADSSARSVSSRGDRTRDDESSSVHSESSSTYGPPELRGLSLTSLAYVLVFSGRQDEGTRKQPFT